MKIILPGIPPSKKNSKQIRVSRRTGNRFISSSDDFHEWHEATMWDLIKAKPGKVEGKVNIEIIFYPPDRRRHDSTNVAESINDLLVDAGIIEEDNWFVIPDIRLRLGGIDKRSPRCEIIIKKL